MIKTTKEHFEIFKKWCLYYIDKFKMDNWKVYFETGVGNENNIAEVRVNLGGYVATIFLNKKLAKGTDEESLKESAKHEAIHLLLGRFSANAKYRYVEELDIEEAEEEVVRKLEKLL